MNILIVALTIFSTSVFASTPKVEACAKVRCGDYREAGATDYTTISISPLADGKARFIFSNHGKDAYTWDFTMEFGSANGDFKLLTPRGNIYATGICVDDMCTFAMSPFYSAKKELVGNSGHIRFVGDKLIYFRSHATPSEVLHGNIELDKL